MGLNPCSNKIKKKTLKRNVSDLFTAALLYRLTGYSATLDTVQASILSLQSATYTLLQSQIDTTVQTYNLLRSGGISIYF